MTISRKLIIALTLALGIQFSAGAFCNDTQDQKNIILTFAQDLRIKNSTQAQTVAKWLDERAIEQSWNCQAIIDVITNYNLTEQSKLTLLSEMIKKQKSDNRKRSVQRFVSVLCGGLLCVGACSLFVWAMIEEIKNPRPIVYYPTPKPGITITYKTSSWPQKIRFQYPNWYQQTNWYYIS